MRVHIRWRDPSKVVSVTRAETSSPAPVKPPPSEKLQNKFVPQESDLVAKKFDILKLFCFRWMLKPVGAAFARLIYQLWILPCRIIYYILLFIYYPNLQTVSARIFLPHVVGFLKLYLISVDVWRFNKVLFKGFDWKLKDLILGPQLVSS